jgi:hypothetical protein
MPAALLRQIESGDVACPAGQAVGDASVLCRVDGDLIDGHVNPSSIERFCTGGYMRCPVWRDAREAEWRARDG